MSIFCPDDQYICIASTINIRHPNFFEIWTNITNKNITLAKMC